jgi:hypothetical protein
MGLSPRRRMCTPPDFFHPPLAYGKCRSEAAFFFASSPRLSYLTMVAGGKIARDREGGRYTFVFI